MKMIPNELSRHTDSRAEQTVFRLLADAKFDATIYHSLNLTRHEYKHTGELDFVVLAPSGILVLEVKGGRVARDAHGKWVYTNRFGGSNSSLEGPFKQAESGMYALRRRLEERFGKPVRGVLFGYGVVFPDVAFETESAEWDREMILDHTRLQRPGAMRSFIAGLSDYWQRSSPRLAPPGSRLRREMESFLRPEFDRVVPVGQRASDLEQQMEALTEQQYRIMDAISESRRILVRGGAGSGKTMIAAESARRHATAGERVLLVCESPPLAAYLRAALQDVSVEVKSLEQVRPGAETWDTLVVDEAQDIADFGDLARLGDCLEGGIEEGRWRFFLDDNNQAGIAGRFDETALAYLEEFATTPTKLGENCRNTSRIVRETQLMTAADLGIASAGDGPAVEWEWWRNEQDAGTRLERTIRRLLHEDVAPGSITILSPRPRDRSAAGRLPADLAGRIVTLTESNARGWPLAATSFSTIRDFKGLENQVVIVIDIDDLNDVSTQYVGMTRARALLVIMAAAQLKDDVLARQLRNRAVTEGTS